MCVFNDCENCELDRKTVSLNSLKIKLSIDDGGGGKIQRTTQLRECSKICLPCPSLSYFCLMFNYCAAKVVIIFIYGCSTPCRDAMHRVSTGYEYPAGNRRSYKRGAGKNLPAGHTYQ